jgi:hypothetical protein
MCILRAYFQSSFHRSFPFFSGCKHYHYRPCALTHV